jgi:hypothetical protein
LSTRETHHLSPERNCGDIRSGGCRVVPGNMQGWNRDLMRIEVRVSVGILGR